MAKRKQTPALQGSLLEAKVKTAPCVPAIRKAVAEWKNNGYKGVTETTEILLNHWFHRDHKLIDGSKFTYHPAQQEAIETLIYLFEVVKVRTQKNLLEKYAEASSALRLSQYDDFARYCIKMATGSGKTKVMALAIAWQYFNAVCENDTSYAKTSLVIAPNVIVFERLKADFANGKIFKLDPIIPPELEIHWDLDCYMRGDGERANSLGSLYLSNVQQFYEHGSSNNEDEPEEMAAVMGSRPPASLQEIEDFSTRIKARGGPVLLLNDEAHHTHDDNSEWNNVIRNIHEEVSSGLAAQLDFSATPRFSKGSLFVWTVFDYPLKQAIIDGIVKRPMKGIAKGIDEQRSEIASTRYAAYLTAGVERWREYKEQLVKLQKKPILFVMMNSTDEAEEVGDYLRRKYPSDFGGEGEKKNLLIIHTDKSGEVSKRDLDEARDTARRVDEAESTVNAIVSVLMLREGWDVQNVTVVVGLRPYSSKANILPEQTIGRGLRLMFRNLSVKPLYTERVDVIGNKAFIEFVEQLERDEDIKLGTFEIGADKLQIVVIEPVVSKIAMDIKIPFLSPILVRKRSLAEEIAALDVQASMPHDCPKRRMMLRPGISDMRVTTLSPCRRR